MSFYTRVTTFIRQTLIKASDANAEFDAVQSGFDAVKGVTNRSLKGPASEAASDIMTMTEVAASRANKILFFGPTGSPYATTSLPVNLNANGFKITGAGPATSPSDYTTLSDVQALISGGGTPSNIAITDLNDGTLTNHQTVKGIHGSTALQVHKLINTADTERAIRQVRMMANSWGR